MGDTTPVSRRVGAIKHPMVTVTAQNNDNGIRPIHRNLRQLLINDMEVAQASAFGYESDSRHQRVLIVLGVARVRPALSDEAQEQFSEFGQPGRKGGPLLHNDDIWM